MSKLVEALKTCGSPQPMGFKSAQKTAAKPKKLLIIASQSDFTPSRLTDNLSRASALLISSEMNGPNIKTVAKAAAGIPWGLSLASQPEEGLALAIKGGADFFTFSWDAPLKALPGRETGRVLEVSIETAEKLPRAVNDSPVDAVYFITSRGSEPLTWHHLMMVRALSSWLSKPLLVSVPDAANGSELQALWDAGAAGIVAFVRPGNIARLCKIIDKLDYPAQHPGEKTAVLPFSSLGQTLATDTEEDEDW